MEHPHHPAHVLFGVTAVALAAVLGFHFLLYAHLYGIGLALFLLILAGSVVGLYVLGGQQGNAWAFIFIIPFILSLVAEVMLASDVVRFFGFLCSVGSLAMFGYWLTSPPVRFRDVRLLWPGAMIAETLFPFPRFKGYFHALAHGKSDIRRVMIGVVIALPFLTVIGLLFVSSDLLLQKNLNDLLTQEALARFLRRAFWDVFAAVFFLSAGWTIMTRMKEARRPKTPTEPEGLDAVVVGTFLTLLNLLFIAFIAFQFVSIFGGAAAFESRGITYAAYAREGFFQLLAVSVIVLAVIAGIYHFTAMRSWSVRWLAAALVFETGVVIASAVRRMALYIDAYGLTVLRAWSTFAIILIATAFVVVLVAMFSRVRFDQMLKSLAIGSLTVISLSLLVNVEDMIVRFNFNRFIMTTGPSLDLAYLESLSSDAVPALVEYSRLPWPNDDPGPRTLETSDDHARLNAYLQNKETYLRVVSTNDPLALVISDYRAIAAIAR